MSRRADASLFSRIATLKSDMATLEYDLRQYGDRELSAVIKRARRELQHQAFTGAENTNGVNAGAIRR